MKLHRFFLLATGWLLLAVPAGRATEGDTVLLVYNRRMPESQTVAEHYAAVRHVPAAQVWGLDLSTNEEISRVEYRDTLETPLLTRLTGEGLWTFGKTQWPATIRRPAQEGEGVVRSKIRYLVLCYGVPLKIAEDDDEVGEPEFKLPHEFYYNHAAVDSELAALPMIRRNLPLTGLIPNPFCGGTNHELLTPTNGILLTARLDGPSATVAGKLVDLALEAETNGLWGRAYFDARGLPPDSGYHLGDEWILSSAKIAHRLGFETNVDDAPDTFRAGYPLEHVGLYAGWYDTDVSGPFAEPTVEFMPGAFAYHLHSYSAKTLRSLVHNWCGPLLGKGATCTMGCVYEPYLIATPNVEFFLEAWANGFNFGEAAWAAQAGLSWQTTVIGDPLYRPFGRDLVRQHRQMLAQRDPRAEWSAVRLLNINSLHGAPRANEVELLRRLGATARSPVLSEKLADLYDELGKPASCIEYLGRAVTLAESPNQRLRLRLKLAEHLEAAGQKTEAQEDLRQLLAELPAYPQRGAVEARLKKLGAP